MGVKQYVIPEDYTTAVVEESKEDYGKVGKDKKSKRLIE